MGIAPGIYSLGVKQGGRVQTPDNLRNYVADYQHGWRRRPIRKSATRASAINYW